MKKIIRLLPMIGLLAISPLAVAVDLFQTGETLTADKLNDIDHRIMALGKTYVIGDTGPAGGIVFYSVDLGHHGLEAAPEDQVIPNNPGAEWGCYITELTGADGTAIGTGAQNTVGILAGCSTDCIAARLADAYTLNGFNDWFLPSSEELFEMYLNRDVVGGSASGDYWSSSEYASLFAIYLSTNYGFMGYDHKSVAYFGVRAVRVF